MKTTWDKRFNTAFVFQLKCPFDQVKLVAGESISQGGQRLDDCGAASLARHLAETAVLAPLVSLLRRVLRGVLRLFGAFCQGVLGLNNSLPTNGIFRIKPLKVFKF